MPRNLGNHNLIAPGPNFLFVDSCYCKHNGQFLEGPLYSCMVSLINKECQYSIKFVPIACSLMVK